MSRFQKSSALHTVVVNLFCAAQVDIFRGKRQCHTFVPIMKKTKLMGLGLTDLVQQFLSAPVMIYSAAYLPKCSMERRIFPPGTCVERLC